MIFLQTHTRLIRPFRGLFARSHRHWAATRRAPFTHEPLRLLAATRAPRDKLLRVEYQGKKKPAQVPAFERIDEKLIAWKIEGDVAPSAGLPSYVRLLLRLA